LPLVQSGELVVLPLHEPFPPSACCLTWQQNAQSPAMAWLLDYLGDSETLNQEWLSEEEQGG
jgi:DNA-binding transcriptional LysR family regulator